MFVGGELTANRSKLSIVAYDAAGLSNHNALAWAS
jgi:hypothetical protein